MKIRSLLLGTVAAAGLSTAAFATDLGVETGLDVCDDLGLTGLTISSDTNCLQISGSVKYEFVWGDYDPAVTLFSAFDVPDTTGSDFTVINGDGTTEWTDSLDAWLKFVATADSSFGPASATIKWDLDSSTISQLYVSIGEGTVITAGRADSIFKNGNDEPLNFLGLFNSSAIDAGVIDADDAYVATGGNVLQVVSSMDNFWIGAALEDLGSHGPFDGGTAVGVVAYNTDEIKAHASFAVDNVLAPGFNDWIFHAGFEGTFDTVKLVAAYGANADWTGDTEQNGLISASIDLDNFVIAGSAEFATQAPGAGTEYGYGASIASEVSDGITVKLGYRHYSNDWMPATNTLDQIAGQVVAAVSDEVTITGEAGAILNGSSNPNPLTTVYYGSAKVEWNPGGDFKGSVKGEANNLGGYKITTDVEKSF